MKFSTASLLALVAPCLISVSSGFVQPRVAFSSGASSRSFAISSSNVITALRATSIEDFQGAQAMIDEILLEKNCGPFLVRLAWHDSGTFDKNVQGEWPAAGGAVGSIRFDPEIKHGANAGLSGAVKILEPVKEAFPAVSFADIYQMASCRAIALAGGPKIDVKYGRIDAEDPAQCSPEGNLPDAEAGPSGEYGTDSGTASTRDTTPNGHLRKVFYRMGLSDEDIVALSGAHTFGRAYKDRSGLGKEQTKFTDGTYVQIRADGVEAKYTPGGSSWTEQWLVFDNSFFHVMPDKTADPDLLKLSTDVTLFNDEEFRPFAEKFRDSQDAFFESYAIAHKKLSELGSKFDPPEGITM